VQVEQKTLLSKNLIETAEWFHGHLGPFLIVGLKMGLLALRKLKKTGENGQLRATVKTELKVPYTCALDGIQIATHCTIGNRRLKLENAYSPTIAAKFRLENSERTVKISVKPEFLRELEKKVLGKGTSSQEMRKLAWEVASTPEDNLFIIECP